MNRRSDGDSPRGQDSGQVLPLMALVVMLTVVTLAVLVRLGTTLDDAARARTAADAAALAGAVDGRGAAEEIAAGNGGELLRFNLSGDTADVDVRVGQATASARATAEVQWLAPTDD